MLVYKGGHRYYCERIPKPAPGGMPWRKGLTGWTLPGFALEPLGLCWKDAAIPPEVKPTTKPLQDPLALFDLPVQLWPHQHEDALQMCCTGRWGEWAEVGLGKTLMVLSAFSALKREGRVKRLLVIGPESAGHAWVGRSADTNLFGYSSTKLVGHRKDKGFDPAAEVTFCNYDKAWRNPYTSMLQQLLRDGKTALVLDEAHQVCGTTSKRFQQIELWMRLVEFCWPLSGTPIQNYPDRLWAMWRFLTGEQTTSEEWVLWFKPDGRTWHTYRLACLGRYMRRFTRVRTRKEVAPHLPATTSRTLYVPLLGEQRAEYEEWLENFEEASIDDKMVCLTKMLNVCSHPDLPAQRLTSAESKLETLLSVLDSIGDKKAVIWSWHPATLEWLAENLKEWNPVQYHGRTSEKDRAAAVYKFNTAPEVKLFLGNPKAAGAGLNLPAGEVRIYWDSGWSHVEYTQSAGRIERGLNYTPRMEYRLVAEGTVEEYCWEAIAEKRQLSDIVLQGAMRNAGQRRKTLRELWAKRKN